MRKTVIFVLLSVSMCLMARPNYKYILQHYDSFSPREALYRLREYQEWVPTQAHCYYLMGNLYYQLYRTEHPIHDYQVLDNSLYSGALFYGNCAHYLHENQLKKEWYAEAAENGKVSEESISNYVLTRRDTLLTLRQNLTTLHEAYARLVNRYDTCRSQMAMLCDKYGGEKDLHLLLDSADRSLLMQMRQVAQQLPEDIRLFQQALEAYPIPDYQPVFSWQRIDYFRMDGLTTSDFLQSQIVLWNYAEWVDRFLLMHGKTYRNYRESMDAEQRRLAEAMDTPQSLRENRRLINTIHQLDASSAMGDLLHLEYLSTVSTRLGEQILAADSLTDDTWLMALQRLYKMSLCRQELVTDADRLAAGLSEADQRKYADFLQTYFADDLSARQYVGRWKNAANSRYEAANLYLAEKGLTAGLDTVVRIDERLEMVISVDGCSPREWQP